MFKEKIKNLIYFFFNLASALGRLFIRMPRAAILMYHSVDNNEVLFVVTPADFERQMEYLRTHDYKVISLSQLVYKLKNQQKPEDKTVVLTFDDGYFDNYANAWPLLKKYNFPATIFLPTAYLDNTIANSQNMPLKVMGQDQIKEMFESGLIEFGSHTHTHPRLEKLSQGEFLNEVHQSKEIIEKITGKKCEFFSYPKGFFKEEFIEALKNSGFAAAVTVQEGLISNENNLYLLRRNFIYSAGGFSQFKGKLNYSVLIYKFFKKLIKP